MILPRPEMFAEWKDWATRLVQALGQPQAAPISLPAFSKTKLPSAKEGKFHMILVSDEVGGSIPAFSDGTNWRRVTDRAIVA